MDMFISYRKRVDDLQDNLDELDEDDEDNDQDSEVQEALQYFVKKGKGKNSRNLDESLGGVQKP